MRYFEKDGQKLVMRHMGETLVIEPWGEDSLRVRAVLMGDVVDNRYALLEPARAADVEMTIGDEVSSIRNGKITATVHFWEGITFTNEKGEVLTKEIGAGGTLRMRGRKFEPILGGDHRLTVSFEGFDGEHLYGMGQYQEENLDWKGCTLELAQRNSQATVPFVMSSRGYGMLWHNPAIGHVHFGKNRTSWHADSTKQMDYWITAGSTPADISLNYAKATGFAPMMPEYGLGFWQCKLRYWNQEQLLSVAREYKRRGLPIDVIVCDFFHWPHLGDYRFDPEFFPDPAAMVRELKEMGIELMASVWTLVGFSSENYEEMRQQGLLVRAEYGEQIGKRFVENGMYYDATNPRAQRYVWEKCKKNYYDLGIRLFWLDEAEPEYGSYDFKNFRCHMGSNQQIGNMYPQQYSKGFWDGMVEAGQENPVNLVRCAWAGSQRYGALVWSGDIHSTWQDFRNQLCAGISVGAAGIPWWTTDIGGFQGGDLNDPEFRELLVRWFQWATYCPVMRLHGDRKPVEEVYRKNGEQMLSSGSDNEVWSFGEDNYPILVKYMRRREELRDYVRGLMREAHETGKPLIRGMFYEFPGDENCADIKDQYMFGEDYLVAPVMQPGATSRKVYLPAGTKWRNEETGEVTGGGQWLEAPAPIDVIPVFIREA